MPASGRLHSTLDRPCVRRQAGRGSILGVPTASRSSDRCPRTCSGPTARTPPEPLPVGHEPIVRAAMQGEVVRRVRAAVRPRDPVMELHCLARPAHVTALANEGAAPVVPVVDLSSPTCRFPDNFWRSESPLERETVGSPSFPARSPPGARAGRVQRYPEPPGGGQSEAPGEEGVDSAGHGRARPHAAHSRAGSATPS